MDRHHSLKRSEIGAGVLIIVTSTMLGFFGAAARPMESTPPAIPIIKPVYAPLSVFSQAIGRATAPRSYLDSPVIGAVVNHHLIAADFIADTLRSAVRPGIDRIILLSPNHFYTGHGPFITTRASFATPYGVVPNDQVFIRTLVQQHVLNDNPKPFQQEHGVYNILPFVKKYFPGVPIIPIITRDSVIPTQVDQLAETLNGKITSSTLVVASLDFAHNQTNEGADLLDWQSLELLVTMDPSLVQTNEPGIISVDSPMTLRLFLSLMRKQGTRTFTLQHHSNSAKESGHLEATNVTSYITGIFRHF